MKRLLVAACLCLMACSSSQKKESTTATASPTPAPGPVTLTIVSPKEGEVVKTKDVPVTFDLKNYEVQAGGQHIHLILDNEPYQPCFTVAEPCVLKDVKSGVHTLRAFPSRAWHESIKNPEAFAHVTFYVNKKKGKSPVDFDKPLLTYSRPKGKYEGDAAKKILFDFWLTNATLGPDSYKVRYKLDNDKAQTLDEWKPTYFENLKSGKHKLTVELLDKAGHRVKGKYNKTTREFEVAP